MLMEAGDPWMALWLTSSTPPVPTPSAPKRAVQSRPRYPPLPEAKRGPVLPWTRNWA